jgi:hypothetical protein
MARELELVWHTINDYPHVINKTKKLARDDCARLDRFAATEKDYQLQDWLIGRAKWFARHKRKLPGDLYAIYIAEFLREWMETRATHFHDVDADYWTNTVESGE